MRILVNFMSRNGWTVHCLAEDAKTVIGPFLTVSSDATLIRLFRACGASDADVEQVERNIERWGRGSVWIDVTEQGEKLLRLRV